MKTALLTVAFLIYVTAGPASSETLTLAAALKMSEAANHSLKVSAYDERLAVENVRLNRSGYLPRIDFQGGYTAQLEPQSITLPTGGSFATQQADFAFLSLGMYQTLYDFGRTDARYARALASREATRFGYEGQKQDTFLQVVSAYFRILQTQKLLLAAAEEVTQMTDHQRVAQNLFEQGVVTRNDLLQADVRLSSSRQRRLEVANRLENAWLGLNYLTDAVPGYRGELVEETKVDLSGLDAPAEEVLAGRAEVKAQKKLLEASEEEMEETRGGYYPELFARAGLDYVQNDKVKEQTIMAATIGLKINLFDGFATTSRYRQAVENRSRTGERLRQLEADIALDYRTAVNDARVAAERINVTETSIRQGEENLRINRDRYVEQVGTATEVIDAQALLTQIKTEHYQAMFDYQVALARVKHARGEL